MDQQLCYIQTHHMLMPEMAQHPSKNTQSAGTHCVACFTTTTPSQLQGNGCRQCKIHFLPQTITIHTNGHQGHLKMARPPSTSPHSTRTSTKMAPVHSTTVATSPSPVQPTAQIHHRSGHQPQKSNQLRLCDHRRGPQTFQTKCLLPNLLPQSAHHNMDRPHNLPHTTH